MTDVYVLVHAPLVGPSTWRWVAEELTDVTVVVPDLQGRPEEPAFDIYVRAVARRSQETPK